MDPIYGVLDENFFLTADDTCLKALSKLIDDALATHLQNYVESDDALAEVVAVIEKHLGDVIKSSTFHNVLIERGIPKLVEKLTLDTIAEMQSGQEEVIRELEFVENNFKYIRTCIEPRSKADYEDFVRLLPNGYGERVKANRIMFYSPREKARYTGVGILIRRKDTWTIALKGLRYRKYYASETVQGRAGITGSYHIKEF